MHATLQAERERQEVKRLCVFVLQTADGWQKFTAGWFVGGLSGVAWAWILTQTLPYYR